MKNILTFISFIATDYFFFSIGLFISLNFIFLKLIVLNSMKIIKNIIFTFIFIKAYSCFLISIFIIRSAEFKLIGLIYLLFSVIYKIIDFIKFLNYFDKKDFK